MASHIPGSRVVCGVGLPAAHRGCQGQVEAHGVHLFLPGGFLWEPVFVPACHSPCKHWVLLTEMLANKVSQKKSVSAHLPLKSVSHWMSHTGGEQYKLSVLCGSATECSTFIACSLQSFCELRYEYGRRWDLQIRWLSHHLRVLELEVILKIIEARLLLTN